jgi:hypothetical protein
MGVAGLSRDKCAVISLHSLVNVIELLDGLAVGFVM